MTEQRYSAAGLAKALDLFPPTEQQARIIEAELQPTLVVAGAGSGKTETMANRVVWLVANGIISPGEVLGLTFTRKAAGELSVRIRRQLLRLVDRKLLDRDRFEILDPPRVATYDSFASSVFRDSALRLGREPESEVLGAAAAWQMARRIAISSREDGLEDLDADLDKLTTTILELSEKLESNRVDLTRLEGFAAEFGDLADLPNGGSGEYGEVLKLIERVRALPLLVRLCREFQNAKRLRNVVQYSDQSRLALQAVLDFETVRAELRNRFKVVLLDEYQDTSVLQANFLASIFRGSPVMAVGDPNQAIYGWRGASADNLEQFAEHFSGESPVKELSLSISWRNGKRILDAANAVAAPLSALRTPTLKLLSPGPEASDFGVEAMFEETILDEAVSVAHWLKQNLQPDSRGRNPTAAILFRARSSQAIFVRALKEAGIEFHVLGLGGLLDEPEVVDLVCALKVIGDPASGAELVRLLAGSRWRIAARDLNALSRLAGRLFARDHELKPREDSVLSAMRESIAEGESGSIVEALDFISRSRPDSPMLEGFSELGLERLRSAGELFSKLRSRSTMNLLDFTSIVVRELNLDIEVTANDDREPHSSGLTGFFEAMSGFLATDRNGDLPSFLSWLERAAYTDDLNPRSETAVPGAVQLLTVHGAKGLEWDLVVVPRLVEEEFPKSPRDSMGWTGFGRLPFEFRDDGRSLPVFNWRGVASRKELRARFETFKADVRQSYSLEERRLAYVALTRARHRLLLTGSFWGKQVKPRKPGEFLRELAEAGIIPELPAEPKGVEPPQELGREEMIWPPDPLGGRRKKVEAAARLVESAEPSLSGKYGEKIERLLAERELQANRDQFLRLPYRIPASKFKDYLASPAEVAEFLRRPMPSKPYRATRLGTEFHSWVEQRSGSERFTPEIDSLSAELDLEEEELDEARLQLLKENFEQSEWAGLKPIEVEREIQLPFDGQLVVCKLDAVYERDGMIQIVDWKTGKAPTTEEERESRKVQLALYRIAYSRWKSMDPKRISAVLYYVAENRKVELAPGDDEAELLSRWRAAINSSGIP
ncbi:MAG: ATP-dependent helicase [Homoserinimonas sp.]|nr:ATP-dependent helicase [Homoserinimonas sp.]